jgi:hypothetical protein
MFKYTHTHHNKTKLTGLKYFVCIFVKPFRIFRVKEGSFFGGLGAEFWLRASHFQSSTCKKGATPPVHFAVVILQMGSCELFAWACLKLPSSQSQPLKQLGLQAWAPGAKCKTGFFMLFYHKAQLLGLSASATVRVLQVTCLPLLFKYVKCSMVVSGTTLD